MNQQTFLLRPAGSLNLVVCLQILGPGKSSGASSELLLVIKNSCSSPKLKQPSEPECHDLALNSKYSKPIITTYSWRWPFLTSCLKNLETFKRIKISKNKNNKTVAYLYRIYLNLIKENRKMSTCNRLDLQTLGSQPIMPKNSPNTGLVNPRNNFLQDSGPSFLGINVESIVKWQAPINPHP